MIKSNLNCYSSSRELKNCHQIYLVAVFFVASRYCILIVCRRQIRTCIEIVSLLVSKHPGFLTSVYYSFLYHLHKSISGSKPVTMVPFLFHNTPKTFHRTVVDTFSYSRHTFCHSSRFKLGI